MKCPICGNMNIGKLSKSRFFCSNCFIEFIYSKQTILQILKILEDGSTCNIAFKA